MTPDLEVWLLVAALAALCGFATVALAYALTYPQSPRQAFRAWRRRRHGLISEERLRELRQGGEL